MGAGVRVGARVAVVVEVGLATLGVAVGGRLVGVGSSVAVGIGTGTPVATGAGVGENVGVDVTVGVGGNITIPAGVALATDVRAKRATSVAASMPKAGSRGANGVSSLDRRR